MQLDLGLMALVTLVIDSFLLVLSLIYLDYDE
jgi:hypothetical protein